MDTRSYSTNGQTHYSAIGEILQMMRRARDISQGDLVTILESEFGKSCSISQVSRYERGKQRLPAETAYLCCAIYAYHPVTLTLCLLKHDRRWWRLMLSLDPGRFVEMILMTSYRTYGARMNRLADDEFQLASSMVLTLFDAKLAPLRNQKSS